MKEYLNKVQILKLVKADLTKDYPSGICSLLNKIMNSYEYSRKTHLNAYSLRSWIMGLLRGEAYYGDWVKDRHPLKLDKLTKESKLPNHDNRKYHEGRKQWIDWMIKIHEDAYAIANGKASVNNIIHTLSKEDMNKYKDQSNEL